MKDNNSIFILGFGLSGYRSFGPELQRVGPCRKINLIIGQNNSGKSNLLNFVHDHYGKLCGRDQWKLEQLEVNRSTSNSPCQLSLALSVTEERIEKWEQHARITNRKEIRQQIQRVLRSVGYDKCGEGFWIDLTAPGSPSSVQIRNEFISRIAAEQGLMNACYELNMGISGRSSTSPNIAIFHETVVLLVHELAKNFQCVKIPSLRSPRRDQWKTNDFSGAGIIDRIAQLQNPEHDKQSLKEDFQRIEQFLQEVTDHPDARLEVPYKRDTIIVHMDGRSMPLEGLGTGIHEVIILAAAATSLHNHVICIEEQIQKLCDFIRTANQIKAGKAVPVAR